jgi:hypothetical protein
MVKAVVNKNDVYRSVGVQSVKEDGTKIVGDVLNYGTEEVSIPKLLIAFYDKNNKLIFGGDENENKKLKNNVVKALEEYKAVKSGANNSKKINVETPKNSKNNMQLKENKKNNTENVKKLQDNMKIKQRMLQIAAGSKKQKAGFIRGSTVPFDPITPIIPDIKN